MENDICSYAAITHIESLVAFPIRKLQEVILGGMSIFRKPDWLVQPPHALLCAVLLLVLAV